MISYPRWKIALVAVVRRDRDFSGAAQFVRRGERAAAGARPRRRAGEPTAPAIEELLKSKGVTPSGAFLEQGRLTLRFSSKQDQLKARDLIAEARPEPVHHRPVAGLAGAGLDAQSRLESR